MGIYKLLETEVLFHKIVFEKNNFTVWGNLNAGDLRNISEANGTENFDNIVVITWAAVDTDLCRQRTSLSNDDILNIAVEFTENINKKQWCMFFLRTCYSVRTREYSYVSNPGFEVGVIV